MAIFDWVLDVTLHEKIRVFTAKYEKTVKFDFKIKF